MIIYGHGEGKNSKISYRLRCFYNLGLSLVFAFILKDSLPVLADNKVFNPKHKQQVQDYGVIGQLFKIKEKSLLEEISEKLELAQKEGRLASLQQEFNNRVKESVLRPVEVYGLGRASTNREWTYNTSYRQEEDIKDSRGRVVVQAGTVVNPLDKLSWGEPFIFIDGDCDEQVQWATKQQGRIILVKGAPLELSEKLERTVYFDQGGIYTRKFKIENVPATIKQQGKVLLVSEVCI